MKSVIFLALSTLFLMEVLILPMKVLAIFNGNKVKTMADFPYMCGVYRDLAIADLSVPCGCAILSPNYALTAAHCFYDPRDNSTPFTFFAGSVNFNEGVTRQIFKERDVIIHPDFSMQHKSPLLNSDLAIIKISPELKGSDNIKSIRLAGQSDCVNRLGKSFAITGWANSTYGWTNNKFSFVSKNVSKIYDEHLLWGEVLQLENRARCEELNMLRGYDDEINICSSKSSGACMADTGGPLAVRYSNGFVYLCGIIVHGRRDCSLKHTIYMRVSHYRQWICENTNNEPAGCLPNNSCLSFKEVKIPPPPID